MVRRGLLLCLLATSGLSVAQSGTWRLVQSGDGFAWRSPSGTVVEKYVAASMTTRSLLVYREQFTDAVPSKYPDWRSWAEEQAERLTSWGFTAAGIYSWDMYASAKMPVNIGLQVGAHAIRDDGRYYHCKAINHDYNGMVCAPPYLPPGGGQPDAIRKAVPLCITP